VKAQWLGDLITLLVKPDRKIFVSLDVGENPGSYGYGPRHYFLDRLIENQKIELQQ
jgi:hypothetical protein